MRKEIFITIEKGRDQGKVFKVVEMSATAIEKWAGRALLVLVAGNAEVDVRELRRTSNAAALLTALKGSLSSLEWARVEPLLDALVPQISAVPDPNRRDAVIPLTLTNIDHHIEDVATLVRLRGEVLRLSLDFFAEGGSFLSRLGEALAQQGSPTTRI